MRPLKLIALDLVEAWLDAGHTINILRDRIDEGRIPSQSDIEYARGYHADIDETRLADAMRAACEFVS